ncbi:MAG: calcium-binding protein [Thioclava sp.]|nr:calcium-binding protein [Thioclava sp.]MBD3803827.1 calcium-binding protein [Thioclava sp.]
MLFLSGLLGLFVAGASAGLIAFSTPDEDDAEPDEPHDEGLEAEGPDLLDVASESYAVVSAGEMRADPVASPKASDGDDILWGDDAANEIAGGTGEDQIAGYAGDDTIWGEGGDDRLFGDSGADDLSGGAGADTLEGGDGDDRLRGDEGDDVLSGGFGADTLSGDAGADRLLGGAGADWLSGGTGDDTLCGADGDDTLLGGAGDDELNGDAGDDLLIGSSADRAVMDADTLNGGAGADTLLAGPGDWAEGGEEADLFALSDQIDPAAPATIADYTPGEDRIAVLYDPAGAPEPTISIEPSEAHDGAAFVLLDGVRLAEVLNAGDLRAEDVTLMVPSDLPGATLPEAAK